MSEYYTTSSDYYLVHSGVLGMKWGIRRYQNEDGTLTPEGRIRYGKQAEANAPVGETKKNSSGRYPWGNGAGAKDSKKNKSK